MKIEAIAEGILDFVETAPGIITLLIGLLIVFFGLASLLGFLTAIKISIVIFGAIVMMVGLIIWGEGGAR